MFKNLDFRFNTKSHLKARLNFLLFNQLKNSPLSSGHHLGFQAYTKYFGNRKIKMNLKKKNCLLVQIK